MCANSFFFKGRADNDLRPQKQGLIMISYSKRAFQCIYTKLDTKCLSTVFYLDLKTGSMLALETQASSAFGVLKTWQERELISQLRAVRPPISATLTSSSQVAICIAYLCAATIRELISLILWFGHVTHQASRFTLWLYNARKVAQLTPNGTISWQIYR